MPPFAISHMVVSAFLGRSILFHDHFLHYLLNHHLHLHLLHHLHHHILNQLFNHHPPYFNLLDTVGLTLPLTDLSARV